MELSDEFTVWTLAPGKSAQYRVLRARGRAVRTVCSTGCETTTGITHANQWEDCHDTRQMQAVRYSVSGHTALTG